MSQFFSIHPENPQSRLIRQAAEILRAGGVMVYPTDSCYALGCRIGDKDAMERIRDIRGVDEKHHFTLICRDMSEIARYARVDNRQFGMLKGAFPGSYTFILEASKEVPRRLQHPK
ncbi:MAG TPA: Sua5/YciO/YrdC/YwlC family protein, partial [Burkholderiales bacterium]